MKFKIKVKKAAERSAIHSKVSHSLQRQIDDFQAVEMAKARLKAASLRMMNRPVDEDKKPLDPRLPENITYLSSEELGNLFAQFAIMSQYTIQVVAIAAVERAARARIDKFTRARAHLQKTGTIADKAAKVEVDQAVRQTGFELLKGDSTTTLTEALLNSYVIGRDTCSREMTRRQTEQGRQM